MSRSFRDADRVELREAALSGARSVAGARVAIEALVFGASLVLARLIAPAEFGHAVIALIVTGVAATLGPVVLGARLVQREELDREHVEAAAWLALVLGSVASLLTFFVGPLVSRPLFGAETAELVRLASPAFLLAALTVTPQARLQRRLDFRCLSRIELAASITGASAAVAAAIAGLEAAAIVLGALLGIATTALLANALVGLAPPRLHRGAISDITRFGVPAGLGSLGYTSVRNIDYAIIAAQLGAAQLGAYWRAFQLAVEYQRKVSLVMLRIAFPLYSRTRDLAEMRAIRTRIVRLHATVIYPLLAILVATAPELIPFLYGQAWEPAVLPTQILAIGGLTITAQTGIGPLMTAMGHVKALMAYAWIATAVYGAAVFLASPYGLTAVCVAAVGSGLALFLAARYALESRIGGIPMRAMRGELGPALLGSGVTVVVAGAVSALLTGFGAPTPAMLALAGAAGLGAYAAVLRAASPAAWSDALMIAQRVVRRPRRPAQPGPGGERGLSAPAETVGAGAS